MIQRRRQTGRPRRHSHVVGALRQLTADVVQSRGDLVVIAQCSVQEVDVARRQPDRLDLAQLVGGQRRHDATQARERLVERLGTGSLALVRRRTPYWRR